MNVYALHGPQPLQEMGRIRASVLVYDAGCAMELLPSSEGAVHEGKNSHRQKQTECQICFVAEVASDFAERNGQ